MKAASNSEARKRVVGAVSAQISAPAIDASPEVDPTPTDNTNGPQNGVQDSGAIGRLNEAERADLARWIRRYPLMADVDWMERLTQVVECIVREHTERALAEVERRVEAWIRHGESVPADHEELRAIVRAARQEQGHG